MLPPGAEPGGPGGADPALRLRPGDGPDRGRVPDPRADLAQRLVRAKRKIRQAGIPLLVPAPADLPGRLDAVLRVIYLVFTEGHLATSGGELVRPDLCEQAIRLARAVAALLPGQPEARGLLALLLLTDARRAARTDDAGALVLLADQDRRRWDAAMITEGTAPGRAGPARGPARPVPAARRRSRPVTPTPRSPPIPTGPRSSRSTMSCSSSSRPR